jgi:hypothetical protein
MAGIGSFRGYDSLDALTNMANSSGTFWMRDPQTGALNPALKAQLDQQEAASKTYVPQKGDQRYGFVRFGQGMDPERDNRSFQEKFSQTKGAGLWAMGINPDDPQAETKAQAMLKRILDNPKYTTGVWGDKTWGRDDAKVPSVRQLMAQNPNIPATELLDYSQRTLQAQNALQPRDIGGMIADFLPQIALGFIPGAGPALAAAYGGIKTAVEGGSPLEILLNTAGGYGSGSLVPTIQAAGGVGNFIGQGISKVGNFISNPSSMFSGAASSAAATPFKTAWDVAGNVPSSLVTDTSRSSSATPLLAAANFIPSNSRNTGIKSTIPTAPSRPSQSSPNFVGPRTPGTPTPTPASTPARPAATPLFGQLNSPQPVRRAAGGPIDPQKSAMNPMGGAPASQYGLAGLKLGGVAKGKPVEGYLDGPGDGMSDSIKATIDGRQPARLADGEFVIPADVVSHLGNGSSKAGAKMLYAMMDRIRHARTGNKKQGKQIDAKKYLPA